MLRGTRIIEGQEANYFSAVIDVFEKRLKIYNFEKIYFPSIYEQKVFDNKIGEENTNMMWKFKDKGDRDVCLVPEITALAQQQWNDVWKKTMTSKNLYYIQRCYRYENPQTGRYREFTQLGVEMLGSRTDFEWSKTLLKTVLNSIPDLSYAFNDPVQRGLTYYTQNGFEATVTNLGTQNQIAGGGKYAEGCGWAIGIDRVVLSLMASKRQKEEAEAKGIKSGSTLASSLISPASPDPRPTQTSGLAPTATRAYRITTETPVTNNLVSLLPGVTVREID